MSRIEVSDSNSFQFQSFARVRHGKRDSHTFETRESGTIQGLDSTEKFTRAHITYSAGHSEIGEDGRPSEFNITLRDTDETPNLTATVEKNMFGGSRLIVGNSQPGGRRGEAEYEIDLPTINNDFNFCGLTNPGDGIWKLDLQASDSRVEFSLSGRESTRTFIVENGTLFEDIP